MRRLFKCQIIVALFLGLTSPESQAVVVAPDFMAAINSTITAGSPKMLECYPESEIRKRAHQSVESILVNFTLNSAGKVTWARIKQSAIQRSDVDQCVIEILRTLPFPTLPEGGEVTLTFPVNFKFEGAALRDPNAPKKVKMVAKKSGKKKVAKKKKTKKSEVKLASKSKKKKNQKQASKLQKSRKSKPKLAAKSKKKKLSRKIAKSTPAKAKSKKKKPARSD